MVNTPLSVSLLVKYPQLTVYVCAREGRVSCILPLIALISAELTQSTLRHDNYGVISPNQMQIFRNPAGAERFLILLRALTTFGSEETFMFRFPPNAAVTDGIARE